MAQKVIKEEKVIASEIRRYGSEITSRTISEEKRRIEAESVTAPITMNNVTKLTRHFSPGWPRERMLGVYFDEDGIPRGVTEVTRNRELMEYRMIRAGKSPEIDAKLKEIASQPVEKIVEEIMRMSWAPDKEGKRQNQWDVVLYFEKTGQLVGVKSNLSDPRNPFEYIKQPRDQAKIMTFIHDKRVEDVFELRPLR